jgi:cholest-4-en-3-one 26-monooxygenase
MRPAEIDLYNPDVYVRGVPHETFRWLRAEAPMFFQKEPSGRGYWALTRYEDVLAVARDPARFSSARGTNLQDYEPPDLDLIRLLMVNMDPPQQTKFRRIVSDGFTPRMVALLEPRVRAVVRELLDRVAPLGEVDFVSAIAAELPLIVFAELLGVPQADRYKLFDWTNRLIGFDDPDFQTSFEDGRVAAAEIWQYASQLAETRRAHPGPDLVSVLQHAEVDGARLTEGELDAFFLLLAVGGNETTRNLISGGMLALLDHPDERARLAASPELVPSAVEEMLRWVTPVIYMRRTATIDTRIRGGEVRAGEKIVLYLASANRDEAVFAAPQRFDVGRAPNPHLAFGGGPHFCLGASLARLEVRVMFEELLRRLPDLALAGPVRRLRSSYINGVKAMPVRFARA